jgi:hypothetical protein
MNRRERRWFAQRFFTDSRRCVLNIEWFKSRRNQWPQLAGASLAIAH